jgi:hypothetical protein
LLLSGDCGGDTKPIVESVLAASERVRLLPTLCPVWVLYVVWAVCTTQHSQCVRHVHSCGVKDVATTQTQHCTLHELARQCLASQLCGSVIEHYAHCYYIISLIRSSTN